MDNILPLDKIYLFTGIFLAVSLLVIIAIMLDLWDGVYTARKTGQHVHSHRLRVTVQKMSEYWRFILIGFLVDCLGILFDFYVLPFVAILFGAGLIAIEAKSMFEHAERRHSHAKELPDILRGIIECAHEKDARKIMEQIKSCTHEETTATTENNGNEKLHINGNRL